MELSFVELLGCNFAVGSDLCVWRSSNWKQICSYCCALYQQVGSFLDICEGHWPQFYSFHLKKNKLNSEIEEELFSDQLT
jgi:hypothetical protein